MSIMNVSKLHKVGDGVEIVQTLLSQEGLVTYLMPVMHRHIGIDLLIKSPGSLRPRTVRVIEASGATSMPALHWRINERTHAELTILVDVKTETSFILTSLEVPELARDYSGGVFRLYLGDHGQAFDPYRFSHRVQSIMDI